jgi:group I intron endonuclease
MGVPIKLPVLGISFENIFVLEKIKNILFEVKSFFDIQMVFDEGFEDYIYKAEWVSLNLPFVPRNSCSYICNKSALNADVLVADNKQKLMGFSGIKILVANEYTLNERDALIKVLEWEEIVSFLKRYAKKRQKGEIEKPYCVYQHTNKTTGKTYFGMTCQDPKRRWYKGHGYRPQPHFYGDIEKYGWENFSHEIISTGLSEESAKELEIACIASVSQENLYNLSKGGCGSLGISPSEETRRKISEAIMHKEVSPETRKKISEAKKRSFANGTSNNNHKKIPIYQIDFKTNQIIKKWDSATDASQSLHIDNSFIGAVCKKRYKSAGGFKWEYVKKELDNGKKSNKQADTTG